MFRLFNAIPLVIHAYGAGGVVLVTGLVWACQGIPDTAFPTCAYRATAFTRRQRDD